MTQIQADKLACDGVGYASPHRFNAFPVQGPGHHQSVVNICMTCGRKESSIVNAALTNGVVDGHEIETDQPHEEDANIGD